LIINHQQKLKNNFFIPKQLAATANIQKQEKRFYGIRKILLRQQNC